MNAQSPRLSALVPSALVPSAMALAAAVIAVLLGVARPAMATDIDPFYRNRAPNAPTLLSPANNARLAMSSLQGNIQLSWRNNGDPEGERVSFYLETMYYDVYTRSWKPAVKHSLWTTSCLIPAKGSPGSSVHLAWRVFAMDATKRSRPWYSVSGWSVFQITFPSATPQQPTPRTGTVTRTTSGFDFGNRWEVYGHHAGTGVWTRVPNSPSTFRASWKGKDGKAYQTIVTMQFKNGQIFAVSKFSDGRVHAHFFTDHLDPTIEVAKRLRAVPRAKKLGGQQHGGYGNGFVATYIVTQ